MTCSQPRSVATDSSSAQNARHRMFGSMPRSSTMSRSCSSRLTTDSRVVGHWMLRRPSSSTLTSGRLTWKS
jgi:hypothetical protein